MGGYYGLNPSSLTLYRGYAPYLLLGQIYGCYRGGCANQVCQKVVARVALKVLMSSRIETW